MPRGFFFVLLEGVHHLLAQLVNGDDILDGLGGQANHKVKRCGSALGEGHVYRVEQLLFGDVFVDDVPHPLGTCFRGEGQAAFPHGVDTLHQLGGEVIHPQAGQGKADLLPFRPLVQGVNQFIEVPVIAGGKGGKGDFIVPSGMAQVPALAVDGLNAFLR